MKKQNLDDLYEGPRLERRNKRKKYNRVLNILILVVIVLIFYFGSQLFFSNNDKAKAPDSQNHTYTNQKKANHKAEKGNNKMENEGNSTVNKDKSENSNNVGNDKTVVQNGSTDPNVLNTIVNPSWQPVGTVQAEPHVSVYKKGSVDWDEMMKAVNYATGLTESDYTLWWVGRNGDNQSAITIENNNDHKIYRIYIKWVKDEGWQPTKMEELKENDSPAFKGHK